MTESSHGFARLQVLAAALLFSTGGVAVKATDLNSWQVASFRCGLAVLTLLIALPEARRAWTWRTLLVGAAYASTMVTYVVANKLTTAANAIFLQATAPLYILLLGPWLLGERTRRGDLLYMAALALGMGAFFAAAEAPTATASNPPVGNAVGVLTGLAWGLTLLGLRWLERRPEAASGDSAAAVLSGNLLAFLACLPLALPVAAETQILDWAAVAYLGVIQIGLAYVFLTRGLRHVPALEGSLLLLLEPALGPLWAWVAFGESPGTWSAIGCGVVFLAMMGRIVAAGRFRPPESG